MKYIIAFWCILISFAVQAQRDLPLRIEFETAKDASDYHFEQVGKQGCFIFYEGQSINKDTTSWLFMYYDTNLIKKRNITQLLPASASYITGDFSDNLLFLLFQEKKQKKQPNTYHLVTIDLLSETSTSSEIPNLTNSNIYKLINIGENFLINAYTEGQEYLYFFHPSTRKVTELSATKGFISSVEFIEKDTFSHILYLGLSIIEDKKSAFFLYKTDYSGNIINILSFPAIEDYIYHSARMSILDSNSALIIGTYNMIQDKYTDNLHSGLYTLQFQEGEMQSPTFFNFTQLRTRDSSFIQSAKPFNLNLQLLVGSLSTNNLQYTLTTEVYYPEYTQSGYSSYDPYGYNMPSSPVFTGYRYVNAYVTTFDKDGQLLWHHYIPFENMLTPRLITRVNIFFENQNAVIFYPYNSDITYTRVNGNRVLDKTTSIFIETSRKNDIIEYSKKLQMENWYENNFLIHGYQYLKNNSKNNKGKRYVFFVNKLRYQ